MGWKTMAMREITTQSIQFFSDSWCALEVSESTNSRGKTSETWKLYFETSRVGARILHVDWKNTLSVFVSNDLHESSGVLTAKNSLQIT